MSPRHCLPSLLLAAVCGIAGPPAARAQDNPSATALPDSATRPVPRAPGTGTSSRDSFGSQIYGTPQARPTLLPVFFPATPPVLDSELPPAPAVRDKIWTELAPEANESYYAPLGTRFSEGDLNRRLRQRLDAYRAGRAAALADLRACLGIAHPGPVERQNALDALARTQEPQLAGLTAAADELRRDLYRGGFLSNNGDWNLHRNWQLGEENAKRGPQELLYDEYSVMRAAVYYQEGLAPAQRQLLREVAIEIAETLGERGHTALTDSFEPEQIIFFLPHTARLRVPAGVNEPLAAEIAAFTAAKSALKRELREALFALDRESAGKRERALQELAARQAPRLAALEPMAERIRTGLAALPNPTRPAGPPGLPPALAARMDRYLREKAEVQRAAQQQTQVPAATRATLAEFEASNRARLAALAAEARAIRDEVARVAGAGAGGGAKSVETLLADFMGAFKQQQLQSLYSDYRTAVLAPGLSPAQRQLLFDAALASLDLTGTKDWQAVPD